MNKDDIKRKLTSRKFWMALSAFIGMMIVFVTHDEEKAQSVVSLIMAGAAVVGYLLAEGLADGGHSND